MGMAKTTIRSVVRRTGQDSSARIETTAIARHSVKAASLVEPVAIAPSRATKTRAKATAFARSLADAPRLGVTTVDVLNVSPGRRVPSPLHGATRHWRRWQRC